MIVKSAVQRESDALLLNLFCAAIVYMQFFFILWLLAGKNSAVLDPNPMLLNQRIKGACMTCSSCHQSVLNYPSFQY